MNAGEICIIGKRRTVRKDGTEMLVLDACVKHHGKGCAGYAVTNLFVDASLDDKILELPGVYETIGAKRVVMGRLQEVTEDVALVHGGFPLA